MSQNKILYGLSFGLFTFLFFNGVEGISQNDTLDWVPPERLTKEFPYYLSGYDSSGNPVWLVPLGRWDIKKLIDEGGPILDEFEKYAIQLMQRMHNPEIYGKNGSDSFVAITDLDGFSYSQVFSYGTISELLQLTKDFAAIDKLGRKIKVDYFINSNFLFQTVINLAKPLVGDLFNMAEIFGTDPNVWKPILLKAIPREALPPHLGGRYDHEYIKVFG